MGMELHRLMFGQTAQAQILEELALEWKRQDSIWGADQDHPDGTGGSLLVHERDMAQLSCQHAAATGSVNWMQILKEEFYEAVAEQSPDPLRAELLQVAAVCLNWVRALDRRRTDA